MSHVNKSHHHPILATPPLHPNASCGNGFFPTNLIPHSHSPSFQESGAKWAHPYDSVRLDVFFVASRSILFLDGIEIGMQLARKNGSIIHGHQMRAIQRMRLILIMIITRCGYIPPNHKPTKANLLLSSLIIFRKPT
jgi:hypothetical protein